MPQTRRQRIVAFLCFPALASTILAGAATRSADACTYAACSPAQIAPPPGASVPANALGFPLQPARSAETSSELPNDNAVLRMANGTVVPSTTKTVLYDLVTATGSRDDIYAVVYDAYDAQRIQRLVVPQQPLQLGTYTLYVDRDCPESAPAHTSFDVVAAAPMPTSAGTVDVTVRHQEDYRVRTLAGSCDKPVEASIATVAFTPTPELAAFQSVARIEVVADGITTWPLDRSMPDAGAAQQSWAVSRWGAPLSPRWTTELHTTCQPQMSYDDLGLTEGTHTGQLLVWLAGADRPLPPLLFSFTTSCGVAVDGGAPLDSPPSGTTSENTMDVQRHSGCSMGHRYGGQGAVAFFLSSIAMALAWALKKPAQSRRDPDRE